MRKITAAAARAAGKKYYFTGKPCKRDHTAPRLVSNNMCTVCNVENATKWGKENKTRKREYHRNYMRERNRAIAAAAASRPMPDRCECCGDPRGDKQLCFDHCHETGEFRGWLCNLCNTGIGKLGDNLAG